MVVPSTKPEPFGLVAIEAMAYKKPVIAAQHGGLAEILTQNTGIYFRANDASSLAEAIQIYLQSAQLRSEHGQKGFQHFEDYYSQQAYSNRFIEAIQKQLSMS